MEKVVKGEVPREKFTKKVKLLSVKVPVPMLGTVVSGNYALKALMYKRTGIKPLLDCEGDKKRVIFDEKFQRVEDLPEPVRKSLGEYAKDNEPYEVELKYENFDAHEVLSELLPKEGTLPIGYELVGSIMHFNLPVSLLPYKNLIGQIYLDKTKGVKTVVTKIDHIENVYRFYKMEVLAGEMNFITQQKEYSCTFELDLSKVYWCSRLSEERRRMVGLIPKNSVLCDMFCGVGPLSVHVAKDNNCRVLANDLNPDCYVYLKKNIVLNRVEGKVIPFNMDAREFVRRLVKVPAEGDAEVPKEFVHFDHVYMNLPVDAVEFLDVFCGLFKNANKTVWNEANLPIIHVYAFTEQESDAEAKVALCARINKMFGQFKALKPEDVTQFHQIRDVSGKTKMYALTFSLSKEVAYAVPTAPALASDKSK